MEIVDQLSRPIFIVGAPRSGTTLVARILHGHSRIANYHETQYYPFLRADLHRHGDLWQLPNMKRFIDDLRELTRELQAVNLPPTNEFTESLIKPAFEGVLATLLQLHARTAGKPIDCFAPFCQRRFPGALRREKFRGKSAAPSGIDLGARLVSRLIAGLFRNVKQIWISVWAGGTVPQNRAKG